MHWVIQTNVFSEDGFETLIAALKRLKLSHTLVKVVPFVGDLEVLEGELPADGNPIVVMGTYSLARVAMQRGWKPGAFLDNLDFEIQRRHWGDYMLNNDAIITTFDNVQFQREPFFLRPVHDTKAFTGMVIDWGYYEKWRDSVCQLAESVTLTKDTPVMVCQKKEIYTETRFWIVNRRVVTASGYKIGTIKRYQEVRGSRWDNDLIEFADDRASEWSPNEAYVLDVAETPEGMKIVEVNNLNSAGFYKGDMQKLLHAIEGLR